MSAVGAPILPGEAQRDTCPPAGGGEFNTQTKALFATRGIRYCILAFQRLTPSEPTAQMGRSEPFATSLQEQYTLRLFCSLRSKTARKVLRSFMHSLPSPPPSSKRAASCV